MQIDREHPDYAARRPLWQRYRDLYAGGEQLKTRAHEYIARRHREPLDRYLERTGQFFYENYAGSIIDWFAATLFRREPVLTFSGLNLPSVEFCGEFAEDCDLRGTSFTDLYRRQFVDALVLGSSYLLVDFPRTPATVATRADEEACGAARAYLVECSPEQVINWSTDSRGVYEWVVLRQERELREPFSAETATETTWTYYDREQFQVFRRVTQAGKPSAIQLVDEGRHGLARLQKVPLFRFDMPEGLWLMNKAGQLQTEHLNKSNALAWALSNGLFAMPVVFSEREVERIFGEAYYLQLDPNDKFGWTEPQGRVYEIAADNLQRLKDEIYRVCFLLNQAGSSDSVVSQSGLSKQRDFAVTQEVLRAFGDLVKAQMKRVLRAIVEARQDDLLVDVAGLDEFDIGDFRAEIEAAERLLALPMGSSTLKQHVYQRLAQKYLCDARQDIKDRIAREIEASLAGKEQP